MAGNMNSQYLESKVLTASQPRLHLMLLEAAVRKCRVAQQAGQNQSTGVNSMRHVDKAMDIVEELVRSVSGKKMKLRKSSKSNMPLSTAN